MVPPHASTIASPQTMHRVGGTASRISSNTLVAIPITSTAAAEPLAAALPSSSPEAGVTLWMVNARLRRCRPAAFGSIEVAAFAQAHTPPPIAGIVKFCPGSEARYYRSQWHPSNLADSPM